MSEETVDYSTDELHAPEWLNKQFFTTVVASYKHDPTITVLDLKILPGTKAGEHYASVMFRAHIKYSSDRFKSITDNELKLIMKIMPFQEGVKLDMLKDSPMFYNEIKMYRDVLPEMERLLAQTGESITFAPPFVYGNLSDHPSPVLVLLDISDDGFATPDWSVTNYDTIQLVTKTIAKFHAASVVMREQGYDLTFGEHVMANQKDDGSYVIDEWMRSSVMLNVEMMREWAAFEKYADLIEKNYDKYIQQMADIYKSTWPTSFQVLNHGDFHAKNILIRNEGRKQEDFYLIDYQFPIWTSPVVDLYDLANLMSSREIRAEHRDDILRLYFNEFIRTLRNMEYRGREPTRLDLNVELLRCSVLDLLQSLAFMTVQYCDMKVIDLNAGDPSEIMGDLAKKSIQSIEYQEHIRQTVKRMAALGTLEL